MLNYPGSKGQIVPWSHVFGFKLDELDKDI